MLQRLSEFSGTRLSTEQRYCDVRDEYIEGNKPRQEIIRWFGMLELLMAGNALWGETCPRYNKSAPRPQRPVPSLDHSYPYHPAMFKDRFPGLTPLDHALDEKMWENGVDDLDVQLGSKLVVISCV